MVTVPKCKHCETFIDSDNESSRPQVCLDCFLAIAELFDDPVEVAIDDEFPPWEEGEIEDLYDNGEESSK